jgi:hypothetical protein
MTQYFERIIDAATGEETIRPYTAKEIETAEIAQAQAALENAKRDAAQAAKDAAKQAVLNKLGLTADEIAALLG